MRVLCAEKRASVPEETSLLRVRRELVSDGLDDLLVLGGGIESSSVGGSDRAAEDLGREGCRGGVSAARAGEGGRRTGKVDGVRDNDSDDMILERVGVDIDLGEKGAEGVDVLNLRREESAGSSRVASEGSNKPSRARRTLPVRA